MVGGDCCCCCCWGGGGGEGGFPAGAGDEDHLPSYDVAAADAAVPVVAVGCVGSGGGGGGDVTTNAAVAGCNEIPDVCCCCYGTRHGNPPHCHYTATVDSDYGSGYHDTGDLHHSHTDLTACGTH